MLNSLRTIQDMAHDLSEGSGDLSKRLPSVKSQPDFAILASYINRFISKIDDTVVSAKETATYLNSLVDALNALAHTLRHKTSQNDEIATKTTDHLSVVRTSLEQTVESSTLIRDSSHESYEALNTTYNSIELINRQIAATSESTNELNHEFTQIIADTSHLRSITSVIRDISEQTNLLALNAAIEAARAGGTRQRIRGGRR